MKAVSTEIHRHLSDNLKHQVSRLPVQLLKLKSESYRNEGTRLPGGDLLDPAPARERLRYPLDIQLAKYFVITELDELWAFRQRSVPTVLENSKVLTWPLVFQAGTVRILRNPNL